MTAGPDFAIYAPPSTELPPLIGKVDGWVREEHTLRMERTGHPVESGSTLTDNAVRLPDKLRLAGWVSDLLVAPEIGGPPDPARPADAWDAIYQMFSERRPVDVLTRLRVYRSMLITRATAPVDKTSGRALRFELELEEVQFARIGYARFPPAAVSPRGPAAHRTSQVDGGRRPAADVPLTAARSAPGHVFGVAAAPAAEPVPPPAGGFAFGQEF